MCRMGPLPTDTYLTVASQFVTDFNTDHFRTYSSGYFPVVSRSCDMSCDRPTSHVIAHIILPY